MTQLEKQLPGKAEMDALLSDINQAGLGRGLQFELFRPGQVVVKDYYAELPITIKVTGRYHDIGAFAADVANLSRIVTLHNLNITHAPRTAAACCDGSDRATYRYLDADEVDEVSAKRPLPRPSREPRNDRRRAISARSPLGRTSLLAGVARAAAAPATRTSCSSGWSSRSARSSRASSRCPRRRSSTRSPTSRSSSVEPFSTQKLTVALKQEARQPNSLLAAEINRRKEPLEAYPLDSMTMVGSVVRAGGRSRW